MGSVRVGVSPVKIILVGNTAVFAGWSYASYASRNYNDWAPEIFMRKNFLSSLSSLMNGRVWTVLTPSFSQKDFLHFGVNMFMLYSFGNPVLQAIGAARFWKVYLGAGIVATAAHLLHNIVTERDIPALGASGSVMGISVMYAALFPRTFVFLLGIVPIPAPVAVGGFVLYDFLFLNQREKDHVARASHLAGAAVGAISYLALRRRIF